jgi:hypothetical protein
MWTEKDLTYTVNALLQEGVPVGIVARVFSLDEDLVDKQRKKLRVEKYGTADMEDFLEQIEWQAIDVVRNVLKTGTTTEKARYTNLVMSGRIRARTKRVSDSVKEGRERLTEELEAMKSGAPSGTPEQERSRFVVVAGEAEGG